VVCSIIMTVREVGGGPGAVPGSYASCPEGGQNNDPSARFQGWSADTSSGMLSGWGSSLAPQSVTRPSVDAANPSEPALEADDDSGDSGSESDDVDVSKLQALLCDNAAFFDACQTSMQRVVGVRSQQQDEQGQLVQQSQELRSSPEQPEQRMRNGQQGDCQLGLQILSSEELREALNIINKRCRIEAVNEEEADDLFDGPMDLGVFYQFAREYFGTLCRSLTLAVAVDSGCELD